MDLVHNGGGGFRAESNFHVFLKLLMYKLCQKIGKER